MNPGFQYLNEMYLLILASELMRLNQGKATKSYASICPNTLFENRTRPVIFLINLIFFVVSKSSIIFEAERYYLKESKDSKSCMLSKLKDLCIQIQKDSFNYSNQSFMNCFPFLKEITENQYQLISGISFTKERLEIIQLNAVKFGIVRELKRRQKLGVCNGVHLEKTAFPAFVLLTQALPAHRY